MYSSYKGIPHPKKNNTPEVSIFLSAAGAISSSLSPAWIASVRVHITPRDASMPRYGGRPVTDLNTGTASRPSNPVEKTNRPRGARPTASVNFSGTGSSSGTCCCSMNIGTIVETMEGRKRLVMVGRAVIWPLIHNMVVVTSPIGVHAPPAFAAITINAPNSLRSSMLGRIFLITDTITIVVVKLSSIADMKKVSKPIALINPRLFLALILSVTTLNPWCASTISTIVIAPVYEWGKGNIYKKYSTE